MNLIYMILALVVVVTVADFGVALMLRHAGKTQCPKECLDLRIGVRKGISMAFCSAYCRDLTLNQWGCIKKCPECIRHIKREQNDV